MKPITAFTAWKCSALLLIAFAGCAPSSYVETQDAIAMNFAALASGADDSRLREAMWNRAAGAQPLWYAPYMQLAEIYYADGLYSQALDEIEKAWKYHQEHIGPFGENVREHDKPYLLQLRENITTAAQGHER